MEKIGQAERNPGKGLAVAALALSMLLASLGTSIANIALPRLSSALSAPFYAVQWVVVGYLVALTLSVVFVGRLGDRFGLRRMHLFGLLLFTLASLLCAFAPGLWLLVGARALQGIGAAFLMTLTIALVRDTAGEVRIGRAMGLLGTMSALGTALGPPLGGFLIAATDWRGLFFVLVPIGLLTLVLAQRSLPAGGGKKEALPRLKFGLLGSPGLVPSLVANLCVATVMMTTLIVGPFYLGLALGLDTAAVGLVLAVGPVISIFSGVPSGRLVDLWGAQRVLAVGLIAMTIGAFALAVLPAIFGITGYLAAIIVLTPGYQLFQAANNTAVMADLPGNRRGIMAGLLGLSRNLGLVLGAALMGAIFAGATGTSEVTEAAPAAVADGMRLTFFVAGGLIILAFAATRQGRGRWSDAEREQPH